MMSICYRPLLYLESVAMELGVFWPGLTERVHSGSVNMETTMEGGEGGITTMERGGGLQLNSHN